jgi:hypothetical protein
MINRKIMSILLAGCFSFSLMGCTWSGDGDNNGKEDNRNRKVWNENDRKEKHDKKFRKDTAASVSEPLK